MSDNGKTFKAPGKLIKNIMSHEEVKRHLEDQRVEWKFTMERAAWWGGRLNWFYEKVSTKDDR